MIDVEDLKRRIEDPEATDRREVVSKVLRALSTGEVRVTERQPEGTWRVNTWVKQAILTHFRLAPSREMKAGEFSYFDKVGVQTGWRDGGPRVVPPTVVREGAYVAPGAILMPCFVNIGAYVDTGTMVDTWAAVGSCAQIGKNCHLSGGVGIGGVLEPLQAAPVVIEDNVFIGARSEVVEGCIVREGAVLAMGCYLGRSTQIYNAMTKQITFGEIPSRAVVVPGGLTSRDGTHQTYALIIKKFRDEKTDARTALNEDLR